MKKVGFTFMIALMSTITFAQAKEWSIDKSHSAVRFEVKHLVSMTPGQFEDFSGHIHFDPKKLDKSKVEFTIQVGSINTDNEKRDGHLKSPDFFNVEKYPTIEFNSSKFEKKGDNLYHVTGKLTMTGTTKEVTLPLKITGLVDNPWKKGNVIMGVSIETTLKRSDYGVGKGDWASDKVIGDEVKIDIQMELDAEK